ncbi:MAG TPA: hypothetical protein VJ550_03170 [Geomonas sp.]|nr:hypothetical protein [Geomonas sp.]
MIHNAEQGKHEALQALGLDWIDCLPPGTLFRLVRQSSRRA